MPSPLVCLVGFARWALVLALAIGFARVGQVLAGNKRADELPSGTPHGGDRAVSLRFAAFLLQVVGNVWLAVDVLRAAR